MSKTKFALVVTGTGLLFTVVFNVMLVPKLGYYGAAIARLICEIAMVGVSYYLNRKYCPTPYQLRRIGGYVVVGATLYGLSFVTAMLPEILKYLCNFALLFVYVTYAIKRENIDLKGLIRSVIKR